MQSQTERLNQILAAMGNALLCSEEIGIEIWKLIQEKSGLGIVWLNEVTNALELLTTLDLSSEEAEALFDKKMGDFLLTTHPKSELLPLFEHLLLQITNQTFLTERKIQLANLFPVEMFIAVEGRITQIEQKVILLKSFFKSINQLNQVPVELENQVRRLLMTTDGNFPLVYNQISSQVLDKNTPNMTPEQLTNEINQLCHLAQLQDLIDLTEKDASVTLYRHVRSRLNQLTKETNVNTA